MKQIGQDQVPSNVDKETGEIVAKPYETSQHKGYDKDVVAQYNYVHRTIRNPNEPDSFSKLDADTLSMMLTELTAYYESAIRWMADEKLHLDDLKLARTFKFNDLYLGYKQRKSETNETARVRANMACYEDDVELNTVQHTYNQIAAWHKATGRWIDTCRSQIGLEKAMMSFN